MKQKREEDRQRITSAYGKKLRMNRSIQAEGSFADVKEDLGLRRYQYRGKKKVFMQSMVAAMGRNLKKLHQKIQSGRTGKYLYDVKEPA